MLRTQKSVKPPVVFCDFSRGDTSSSSELLPVYEAAMSEIKWICLFFSKLGYSKDVSLHIFGSKKIQEGQINGYVTLVVGELYAMKKLY